MDHYDSDDDDDDDDESSSDDVGFMPMPTRPRLEAIHYQKMGRTLFLQVVNRLCEEVVLTHVPRYAHYVANYHSYSIGRGAKLHCDAEGGMGALTILVMELKIARNGLQVVGCEHTKFGVYALSETNGMLWKAWRIIDRDDDSPPEVTEFLVRVVERHVNGIPKRFADNHAFSNREKLLDAQRNPLQLPEHIVAESEDACAQLALRRFVNWHPELFFPWSHQSI
jgi:hypothetical protein